jgi:hypothetical protein
LEHKEPQQMIDPIAIHEIVLREVKHFKLEQSIKYLANLSGLAKL